MKKLLVALFIPLICYIIYFDLTHGTLPVSNKTIKLVNQPVESKLSYFEEKVKAGDTVLTIVENKLKSQIPVSINEIVSDFVTLNEGLTPEKIQIGKTYRFPDYSKK